MRAQPAPGCLPLAALAASVQARQHTCGVAASDGCPGGLAGDGSDRLPGLLVAGSSAVLWSNHPASRSSRLQQAGSEGLGFRVCHVLGADAGCWQMQPAMLLSALLAPG